MVITEDMKGKIIESIRSKARNNKELQAYVKLSDYFKPFITIDMTNAFCKWVQDNMHCKSAKVICKGELDVILYPDELE